MFSGRPAYCRLQSHQDGGEPGQLQLTQTILFFYEILSGFHIGIEIEEHVGSDVATTNLGCSRVTLQTRFFFKE
jgi:hypothetical protein